MEMTGWRIDWTTSCAQSRRIISLRRRTRVSLACSWRDIARGYRMLSEFVADAQAADQRHADKWHDPSGRG